MKKVKYSIPLRFLGIILFIYVLSRIDIAEALTAFKEISITYLLLGILFIIIGFSIRTLKWKLLTDAVGAGVSFKNLMKIMAKSVFLGTITPAKIGEFWRAKYLNEASLVSGGKTFYTAFVDRLVDLFVMGIVLVLGLIIFFLKFGVGEAWEIPALVFVLFIFLAFFIFKKIGLRKSLRFLIKFLIPSAWKGKTDIFLNEFDQGLASLNLRLFLKLLSCGFLYYCILIISYYFRALALNIPIDFWYLFFIIAIVWAVLILPITVLGMGTREATFIYFFSLLGISASLAVAFSLLGVFLDILIISLPGAILFSKQKL